MSDRNARLAQIETRLAATTEGEWRQMTTDGGQPCVTTNATDVAWVEREADADFIAHSPGDVRYMLDLVAETERQRDLLAGVLAKWQGPFAVMDTPTIEELSKERGPVEMGALIELINRDEEA